jgi:hypothetical protein
VGHVSSFTSPLIFSLVTSHLHLRPGLRRTEYGTEYTGYGVHPGLLRYFTALLYPAQLPMCNPMGSSHGPLSSRAQLNAHPSRHLSIYTTHLSFLIPLNLITLTLTVPSLTVATRIIAIGPGDGDSANHSHLLSAPALLTGKSALANGWGEWKPRHIFSPLCLCVHHTILGPPGVVWPRDQWPLCPKHAPRPSRPGHFAARAVHHKSASMLAKRGPAAPTTLAIDTDLTALTSVAHFPPVLRPPQARSTCGNHMPIGKSGSIHAPSSANAGVRECANPSRSGLADQKAINGGDYSAPCDRFCASDRETVGIGCLFLCVSLPLERLLRP